MLDINDVETLIKAIDIWGVEPSASGFSKAAMMGYIINDKEKCKNAMDDVMDKAKAETDSRKDTTTLIRAKLIQMRDKITVKDVGEEIANM